MSSPACPCLLPAPAVRALRLAARSARLPFARNRRNRNR
jgi:hypothetical protein